MHALGMYPGTCQSHSRLLLASSNSASNGRSGRHRQPAVATDASAARSCHAASVSTWCCSSALLSVSSSRCRLAVEQD
eukprot:517970-Prymnesium_polylepis.1